MHLEAAMHIYRTLSGSLAIGSFKASILHETFFSSPWRDAILDFSIKGWHSGGNITIQDWTAILI
jgi:hypothetical protein